MAHDVVTDEVTFLHVHTLDEEERMFWRITYLVVATLLTPFGLLSGRRSIDTRSFSAGLSAAAPMVVSPSNLPLWHVANTLTTVRTLLFQRNQRHGERRWRGEDPVRSQSRDTRPAILARPALAVAHGSSRTQQASMLSSDSPTTMLFHVCSQSPAFRSLFTILVTM